MKLKTNINRNWIVFLSFSIILIFILIYIENSRTEHIESRIDTLNNNFRKLVIRDSTLTKNINLIQFKEDSYLNQLDRDTNLILWFIAIVFGLFGILSYTSFNRRVQIVEDDLENKFNNALADLSDLKNDLSNLQADLEGESSAINDQIAEHHFQEKRFDFYLFYCLLSINKNAVYYEYKVSDESLSELTLKSIIASLKYLNFRLKNFEVKPKISHQSYLDSTLNIRKIQNIEIIKLLSEIFTRIEIEK